MRARRCHEKDGYTIMDTINFLRWSNPDTFDLSKRRIIHNDHVLKLPEKDVPNNIIDELRVRDFGYNPPRPRQVPSVDMIEKERLEKYGERVDIDPQIMIERFSKLVLKLPMFGYGGQPLKDQTGRIVYRNYTFPEIMKSVSLGGLGVYPAVWRLGQLLSMPPGAIMRMSVGRIRRHLIDRDESHTDDEKELLQLIGALSPSPSPMAPLAPLTISTPSIPSDISYSLPKYSPPKYTPLPKMGKKYRMGSVEALSAHKRRKKRHDDRKRDIDKRSADLIKQQNTLADDLARKGKEYETMIIREETKLDEIMNPEEKKQINKQLIEMKKRQKDELDDIQDEINQMGETRIQLQMRAEKLLEEEEEKEWKQFELEEDMIKSEQIERDRKVAEEMQKRIHEASLPVITPYKDKYDPRFVTPETRPKKDLKSPKRSLERTLAITRKMTDDKAITAFDESKDGVVQMADLMNNDSNVYWAVYNWLLMEDAPMRFDPTKIMTQFRAFVMSDPVLKTQDVIAIKRAWTLFQGEWERIWRTRAANLPEQIETKVDYDGPKAFLDMGIPGNPRLIDAEYVSAVPEGDRKAVFQSVWNWIQNDNNWAKDQWDDVKDAQDLLRRVWGGELRISINSPSYIAPDELIQLTSPLKLFQEEKTKKIVMSGQEEARKKWGWVMLDFRPEWIKNHGWDVWPARRTANNPFMKGNPEYVNLEYYQAINDKGKRDLVNFIWNSFAKKPANKGKHTFDGTNKKQFRAGLQNSTLVIHFAGPNDVRLVTIDEMVAEAEPEKEEEKKKHERVEEPVEEPVPEEKKERVEEPVPEEKKEESWSILRQNEYLSELGRQLETAYSNDITPQIISWWQIEKGWELNPFDVSYDSMVMFNIDDYAKYAYENTLSCWNAERPTLEMSFDFNIYKWIKFVADQKEKWTMKRSGLKKSEKDHKPVVKSLLLKTPQEKVFERIRHDWIEKLKKKINEPVLETPQMKFIRKFTKSWKTPRPIIWGQLMSLSRFNMWLHRQKSDESPFKWTRAKSLLLPGWPEIIDMDYLNIFNTKGIKIAVLRHLEKNILHFTQTRGGEEPFHSKMTVLYDRIESGEIVLGKVGQVNVDSTSGERWELRFKKYDYRSHIEHTPQSVINEDDDDHVLIERDPASPLEMTQLKFTVERLGVPNIGVFWVRYARIGQQDVYKNEATGETIYVHKKRSPDPHFPPWDAVRTYMTRDHIWRIEYRKMFGRMDDEEGRKRLLRLVRVFYMGTTGEKRLGMRIFRVDANTSISEFIRALQHPPAGRLVVGSIPPDVKFIELEEEKVPEFDKKHMIAPSELAPTRAQKELIVKREKLIIQPEKEQTLTFWETSKTQQRLKKANTSVRFIGTSFFGTKNVYFDEATQSKFEVSKGREAAKEDFMRRYPGWKDITTFMIGKDEWRLETKNEFITKKKDDKWILMRGVNVYNMGIIRGGGRAGMRKMVIGVNVLPGELIDRIITLGGIKVYKMPDSAKFKEVGTYNLYWTHATGERIKVTKRDPAVIMKCQTKELTTYDDPVEGIVTFERGPNIEDDLRKKYGVWGSPQLFFINQIKFVVETDNVLVNKINKSNGVVYLMRVVKVKSEYKGFIEGERNFNVGALVRLNEFTDHMREDLSGSLGVNPIQSTPTKAKRPKEQKET